MSRAPFLTGVVLREFVDCSAERSLFKGGLLVMQQHCFVWVREGLYSCGLSDFICLPSFAVSVSVYLICSSPLNESLYR